MRKDTGDRQAPADFDARIRGYDRGQVDRYVESQDAKVTKLQRRVAELEEWLADSEEEAVRARFSVARADHHRALAEQRAVSAETNKREAERMLAMAERASRQVMTDAEERADGLFQSAVRRARVEVAAEYRRIFDEADKLDSLRLAVAAERVALDEVRADIRSRIGAAAAELNRIADSEYFLGSSAAASVPGEPSPEMMRGLRDIVNAQHAGTRPSAG